MKKSFTSYKKEGLKINIQYEIEYLDNLKSAKMVDENKHPAPWELYKKKIIYNLQEAISCFALLSMREDIYDVKMRMQLLEDGEIIQEEIVDSFESYSIRNIMNNEMQNLSETNNALSSENKAFKSYLGQYANGLNAFYEWNINQSNK